MKRISLLLVFTLFLGLCGCGNAESSEKSAEGSKEVSQSASLEDVSEEVSSESAEESSEESSADPYLDGKKLVVFGDSITALGSWGRTAAEELNMYFFNGAMGGITTEKGLERFDAFVASQSPDFVTILFGMNDLIMTSKSNPRVTPEQFAENLKKLIERTAELGAVPILLTTNPYNPDLFYQAQGQDKSLYAEVGEPLEWLAVYNDVTRTVAEQTGTHLIDMYAACDGVNYYSLLSDGIHLAAKGNEIFASTLVNWFREHYESNPDAPKVSNTDHYINLASGESAPVISLVESDWYYNDKGTMSIRNINGNLRICNTNGLWPDAQYVLKDPISVSVSDGVLNYDISTANVCASILLYFDGATPSAYTDKQYVIINKYLGGKCDSYTGDLLQNQHLSGSIPLSKLGINASCVHDGKVLITGIKIYAAGSAYETVTVKQLDIGVN